MEHRRILIAEDDESIRKLVATLLTRSGHFVATASTGEHAVRLLREENFDVAILDLFMPVTDGFDVLEQIKRSHSRVCVIVLTAAGPVLIGDRDVSRANHVIPKPFDLDELVQLAATCRHEASGPTPPQETAA